jgi:hypothetical protein
MTKLLKISLVSLMLLASASFTAEVKNTFVGTYGVSNSDQSGIELVINKNHTFSYKDFSNPKDKINTTGVWKVSKGFVVLTSTASTGSFHRKWKFSADGKKAKSRKGMTYYTLCKRKIN